MKEQCADCGGLFEPDYMEGRHCPECDARAYRENAEAWREP